MFPYEDFLADKLKGLKRESRYRVFKKVRRETEMFPQAMVDIDGKKRSALVWCSNDYLAMGMHPVVRDAMDNALRMYGAGSGGTRNISGNHPLVIRLEESLANLSQKEAALVFSSGFVANQTALATLGALLPNCVFFSDSLNHASLIEGMRHSRAEKHVFRHNDVPHLRELLEKHAVDRPAIVVFESVYSMEGDFGKLEEILTLSKEFGALTFVDETHAVGAYGPRGGGVCEQLGLLHLVDIHQGGLGKAFGVVGGFVSGSANIIDSIRSFGAGFIFTTSMPPVIAAGALASVEHLKKSTKERKAFADIATILREKVREGGFPVLHADTHIQPIMINDSALCTQLGDLLLRDYGIYVQSINYPTVPRGTERLRVTPSAAHKPWMVIKLINSLHDLFDKLNVRQAA